MSRKSRENSGMLKQIIMARNVENLEQLDLEGLLDACRELNKSQHSKKDILSLFCRDAYKFELYKRTLQAYQRMMAYALLGFYESAAEYKQQFELLEKSFFEIFGKIPAYKNFNELAFINALPETG